MAADLGKVGVTEAAAYLSSPAPVFDLSLHLRVSAFDHAGDNGMSLACALQVGNCLAYGTTGIPSPSQVAMSVLA